MIQALGRSNDSCGARHRCRARETSSRASRANITSSATPVATGNDVPHARRHLCPSKHASRGSPSNPTLTQAGNQAHRPHHVASQSSAVGWSRGMRAALLSTACRGKTSTLLFIWCHCVILHFALSSLLVIARFTSKLITKRMVFEKAGDSTRHKGFVCVDAKPRAMTKQMVFDNLERKAIQNTRLLNSWTEHHNKKKSHSEPITTTKRFLKFRTKNNSERHGFLKV